MIVGSLFDDEEEEQVICEEEEKIEFYIDLKQVPVIMRKEILKYIGPLNLTNASRVCKDWHRFVWDVRVVEKLPVDLICFKELHLATKDFRMKHLPRLTSFNARQFWKEILLGGTINIHPLDYFATYIPRDCTHLFLDAISPQSLKSTTGEKKNAIVTLRAPGKFEWEGFFARYERLEVLSLRNIVLSRTSEFSETPKVHKNLRVLRAHGILCALPEKMPKLEILEIQEHLDEFPEIVFNGSPNAKEIVLESERKQLFLDRIALLKNLTSITLNNTNDNEKPFSLHNLLLLSSLRSLSLQNYNLKSEAFCAEILPLLPQLRSFSFSHKVAVFPPCQFFVSNLQKGGFLSLENLELVNLTGSIASELIQVFLSFCGDSITSLDLSGSSLSSKSLEFISNKFPKLNELTLRNTDHAKGSKCSCLPRTIRLLDLSDSNADDTCMEILFSKCQRLTWLKLSRTNITQRSLGIIAEKGENLRTLDLSDSIRLPKMLNYACREIIEKNRFISIRY